jgi:transposase
MDLNKASRTSSPRGPVAQAAPEVRERRPPLPAGIHCLAAQAAAPESRLGAHGSPPQGQGPPKSVTVTREGEHGYASIACKPELAGAPRPRRISKSGVDLNVATGAVTSSALILPMSDISSEEMSRRARLHKSFARKTNRSRNRLKAKRVLARFQANLARRNAGHQISRTRTSPSRT